MSWVCELTDEAKRDLRDLPKLIQKRVARALNQMESDPFQGNVVALKGEEWKGVFRRRLGDYRLFFVADWTSHRVRVLSMVIRSGKTYG